MCVSVPVASTPYMAIHSHQTTFSRQFRVHWISVLVLTMFTAAVALLAAVASAQPTRPLFPTTFIGESGREAMNSQVRLAKS